MGFWNLRGKKEKVTKENSEREKVEPTEEKKSPEEEQVDQLVEKTISYVISPTYKGDSSYTEYGFKRGKRILTSCSDYMPLFKKGLKQYIIGWKSTINELPSETKLIKATAKAMCSVAQLSGTNIYSLLKLNAEGKYNDGVIYKNIFSDPFKDAIMMKINEKKINEKKLLNERIEKLKSIVNKPIKYGDLGKNNEEVNFDEEFNNFAKKLREQKMGELVIFKLVTRMEELRKQYETVIHHPDKSLMQRLEAQVLLEYHEQIKEDVSTLTWLKIIDGIFGG